MLQYFNGIVLLGLTRSSSIARSLGGSSKAKAESPAQTFLRVRLHMARTQRIS